MKHETYCHNIFICCLKTLQLHLICHFIRALTSNLVTHPACQFLSANSEICFLLSSIYSLHSFQKSHLHCLPIVNGAETISFHFQSTGSSGGWWTNLVVTSVSKCLSFKVHLFLLGGRSIIKICYIFQSGLLISIIVFFFFLSSL